MPDNDVLDYLCNPYINEEYREVRERLARQTADNHEAFAQLDHAAHEVCELIGDDGALDMSQELLPSKACAKLLEAARGTLTAADGEAFVLEVLHPHEHMPELAVLAALVEALRRSLIAASRAYSRIVSISRRHAQFSSREEAEELWRMSEGLRDTAGGLTELLERALDAARDARDPESSGFIGGKVDEWLGEDAGFGLGLTRWVWRSSLVAQQAAQWIGDARPLEYLGWSSKIGDLWPGYHDYGDGMFFWPDLLSALVADVEDELEKLAGTETIAPTFHEVFEDCGIVLYELPARFTDDCDTLYVYPRVQDDTGQACLLCQSLLRRAIRLASIIRAEQAAEDPAALTVEQDETFELFALSRHTTSFFGNAFSPKELKELGMEMDEGEELLVRGMGDCFMIERRHDNADGGQGPAHEPTFPRKETR